MDVGDTPPPEALPKWVSEEYFRSLFRRKSPGEEVAVKKVTVKFADEERIHGKLIRAVVDVDSPSGAKSFSYIIKTPGPGEFSSTPSCANIYRMESLMLGKVIPAMEKVLDAVAPGKYGQLAPRLVDYSIDENLFIMTEDLTVQGFSTGSRQKGLDLEHSLAYAKHLAAFHASSVAILGIHEPEIISIPLLTDSEDNKYLNSFIASSVKGVVSALESHPDLSTFVNQVRELGATLPARLAEANRRRSGVLNVACHGDMFVNNILFRREHGQVAGVRLVDFQLSRVGSFADDLVGFLLSAVSDDVLEHHLERVMDAYTVALNEVLTALGFGSRTLSQEALREELRAQSAVAQFAVFHMLPHSRAATAVDLRSGSDAFVAAGYAQLLRLLLPRLHVLGWLDQSVETAEKEETLETSAPDFRNKNYIEYLSLWVCVVILLSTVDEARHTKTFRSDLEFTERLLDATTSQQEIYKATLPEFVKTVAETILTTNSATPKKCQPYANVCKSSTTKSMLKMDAPTAPVVANNGENVVLPSSKNCEFTEFHNLVHGDNRNTYTSTADHSKGGSQHKKPQENSDLKKGLEVILNFAFFHSVFTVALERSICTIPNAPLSTVGSYLRDSMKTQMQSANTHFSMQNKKLLNTEKRRNLIVHFSKPPVLTNRRRNSKLKSENPHVNRIHFLRKQVNVEKYNSETTTSEDRLDFKHEWSVHTTSNIRKTTADSDIGVNQDVTRLLKANTVHKITSSSKTNVNLPQYFDTATVSKYNNIREITIDSNRNVHSDSTTPLKDNLTTTLGIPRQTSERIVHDLSKEHAAQISTARFDLISLHFSTSIRNLKRQNTQFSILLDTTTTKTDTTTTKTRVNAYGCCRLKQAEQFLPEFNSRNLVEV